MYKITVLGYNENGKIHAVKAIREHWHMGLREAKDWVESLPQTLDGYYSIEGVKWFQEHFRCSIDVIDIIDTIEANPYYSNHNIQEPDEATAAALIWLSAQPEELMKKIFKR
jgi:hypothetical protein